MRFKIDENLPPFIAARLEAQGFAATTVADESLGGTSDERVAPDLSDVRAYPPGSGPGFIVPRLDGQDRSDFEVATELLRAALSANEVCGDLWVVERTRIRVRHRIASCDG